MYSWGHSGPTEHVRAHPENGNGSVCDVTAVRSHCAGPGPCEVQAGCPAPRHFGPQARACQELALSCWLCARGRRSAPGNRFEALAQVVSPEQAIALQQKEDPQACRRP